MKKNLRTIQSLNTTFPSKYAGITSSKNTRSLPSSYPNLNDEGYFERNLIGRLRGFESSSPQTNQALNWWYIENAKYFIDLNTLQQL